MKFKWQLNFDTMRVMCVAGVPQKKENRTENEKEWEAEHDIMISLGRVCVVVNVRKF